MFSNIGALNWAAVALFVGGIVTAAFSLGLGGMVFGLGAVLLGAARIRASRGAGRAELSIGWVLVLGGVFVMVDAVVWMLFW